MNLIDEITNADQELRAAEARATEASRHLRACKRELRECREELSRLVRELKTGQSRHPLLERFGPTGERLLPNGQATHDEHQRGPTEFPAEPAPEPRPARGRRKAK
jgi:chromosome segregation ATPase